MVLLSVLSAVLLTVLLPFLTGIVPINQVPQLISEQLNLFIHGTPAIKAAPPKELITIANPVIEKSTPVQIDLIHDFQTLVQQNADHVREGLAEVYNQYVPSEVSGYVNTTFSYWKTHTSYKVYKDHEPVFNNAMLFVGFLITLKVFISLLRFLFGGYESGDIDDTTVDEHPTVDKRGYMSAQYTEFETMPICVGRAEAEEKFVAESYDKFDYNTTESRILKALCSTGGDESVPGFPSLSNGCSNGNGNGYTISGKKSSSEISILDGSTPKRYKEGGLTSSRTKPELASPIVLRATKTSIEERSTVADEPDDLEEADTTNELVIDEKEQQVVITEEIPTAIITRRETTYEVATAKVLPADASLSGSISSSRSPTPEDSFEREERVLDKSLSVLNESDKSNRPATPSRLSISSSMEYSPSKKLMFKRSAALLTSVPAAETTVGDVTEENVLFKPASSDDSSSEIMTPLRNRL